MDAKYSSCSLVFPNPNDVNSPLHVSKLFPNSKDVNVPDELPSCDLILTCFQYFSRTCLLPYHKFRCKKLWTVSHENQTEQVVAGPDQQESDCLTQKQFPCELLLRLFPATLALPCLSLIQGHIQFPALWAGVKVSVCSLLGNWKKVLEHCGNNAWWRYSSHLVEVQMIF